MQDRQFLEKKLEELKQRKIIIKSELDIEMAKAQVIIDEIQMQIDDIQKHFDSCVESENITSIMRSMKRE